MPCETEGGRTIKDLPFYHEQKQHMEAATHMVTLYQYTGEWDELDDMEKYSLNESVEGRSSGSWVMELCAKIKGLGGTPYVDEAFQKSKTSEMAALYAWWLRHERYDRRREAAGQAELVKDKMMGILQELREKEQYANHELVIKSIYKVFDDLRIGD